MVYDQTMLGTPRPHSLETPAAKRRFIRELIGNVQAEILARVADMPESWDGHELRRYIADRFEDADMTMHRKEFRRRRKDYRSAVLERNL